LLVVPAVGDEAWEGGWFSPLNGALYPPLALRRQSRRATKCPPFKSKDSVLEGPNDETAGPSTVCPGQHSLDGYDVVWWDPAVLDLGRKPPFGVRREDLIVKDVAKHVIADGRSQYDQWLLARSDARDAGEQPSIPVATVREVIEQATSVSPAIAAIAQRVQIVDLRETAHEHRHGGAGFGLLVHTLLSRVPFEPSADTIDSLADMHGRVLGLHEEEVREAVSITRRLLAHDLWRRASHADARGACRRETAVTFQLDDGMLVEGVVDLAFEDGGTWTVVDYKSDRELATAGEEQYRHQVALYASAIEHATSRPVIPVLVRL
jgi:hypothetical protein